MLNAKKKKKKFGIIDSLLSKSDEMHKSLLLCWIWACYGPESGLFLKCNKKDPKKLR